MQGRPQSARSRQRRWKGRPVSAISVIVIAWLAVSGGFALGAWWESIRAGWAWEDAWDNGWSAGYQAGLRTSEHFSQVHRDPLHRQKRTEQGLEHANNPIPLCEPRTTMNGPQNSAHERNQK